MSARVRSGFAQRALGVIAGATLLLPGHWAAQFVPGFENLRNPLRWTILIGLAFPVLAGVGIFQLERRAVSWGGASASRKPVLAMRAGAGCIERDRSAQ